MASDAVRTIGFKATPQIPKDASGSSFGSALP